MANASPTAVRVGWELYRRSGFEASHDEINRLLRRRSLDEVSARMYGHYRALAKAGYNHYVSINRFDVARAARPFEGVTATNVYAYLEADLAVRATFVKSGVPFVAEGRTTQVSEVGAVVTIEDEATVGALRALRLTSGEYLQLEFAGGELRSTHARLVGDPEYGPTGRATLDTEFIHLRPVTEIVEGRALSEALTTITLRSDDTDDNAQLVTVDVVGRRVYYLLEALELSRALVNEVLLRQAVTSGTLAEPPRLASLRMSSPLELVASIANSIPPVPAYGWSLYAVLLGTADRASDIIQKTANAKKTRAESEVLKQEARRLELGNDALEDRNLTSHLIQEHIRHSLTAGGVILGERTGPTMRFINLDKRFEEVILKLVEQEVRHLETGPDEAA